MCSERFAGASLCFVPFLFLTACQTKSPEAPPRYAVVRFENLSGDPSLDWVGRAVSEELPACLKGALNDPVLNSQSLARTAPGISNERSEALLAGANRIVSGYIERTGSQVRIASVEENVPTNKSDRFESAEDSSPVGAINALATEWGARGRSCIEANANSVRLFATGLDAPAGERQHFFDEALRADPNFGPAWLALARLDLAQNDRNAAEDVIQRSRTQKIDALSRASLDLEAAALHADRTGEIEALRQMVVQSPGDDALLKSLANGEMEAGDFKQAAEDWTKVSAALPRDPLVWNMLAYARAYAGNYDSAMAALAEYRRLQPNEANPLDSTGDVNYLFRKFGEAAANYLEANKKGPNFEQHGALYKAAWAKFESGDRPAADSLFAQFRAAREKDHDPLLPLISADWLFRTGRRSEAVNSFRTALASTKSPVLTVDGYAQLAVWDLIEGDRASAMRDAARAGTDRAASVPAVLSRFVSMPPASAAEWQARAEHMFPANAGNLRKIALGYALLLDGKKTAALPAWEQIVHENPATDFFYAAVYARLEGKQPRQPLLPSASNQNPFAALLDSL